MNPQQIAEQFLSVYYSTGNESQINFYGSDSCLTFESECFLGAQNISEKLQQLKVKTQINTCDVQPSVNDGILIYINGALLIDGEQNPIKFNRVYILAKNTAGYYIRNDIFKLIYG